MRTKSEEPKQKASMKKIILLAVWLCCEAFSDDDSDAIDINQALIGYWQMTNVITHKNSTSVKCDIEFFDDESFQMHECTIVPVYTFFDTVIGTKSSPQMKTIFLRQVKTTDGLFTVLDDDRVELIGNKVRGIHFDTLNNKSDMNLKKCNLRKLLSTTTMKKPSKQLVDWENFYKLKFSKDEMELTSNKQSMSFRRKL
jgi:hypothetical protein